MVVVDPGTSVGSADAAHGVRSDEGRWTRGVVATLQWLQVYCFWFRMEVHVTKFFKQCRYYMDSKAGEKILRRLVGTVHGRRSGEVFHFDYLCVVDSGPLGKDG